jgi:hypothetical protein
VQAGKGEKGREDEVMTGWQKTDLLRAKDKCKREKKKRENASRERRKKREARA